MPRPYKKTTVNTSLNISDPCHEDWHKMEPVEKGKLCDSCQRTVHDLVDRTYEQVVAAYRQSGGNICGRVNAHELRKGFIDQNLKQLRAEQVRNFFLAVLLSFGVSLFSVTKASAVNALEEIKTALFESREDTMLITGTISDKKTGEPLPFVNVTVYSGDSLLGGTTTDLDGNYKIRVGLKDQTVLKLRAEYIGYTSSEMIRIPVKDKIEINMKMDHSHYILQGDIIIIEDPERDDHKLNGSGKRIKRQEIRRMPK